MVKAVALLTCAALLASGCARRDWATATPRYSLVGTWAFKRSLPKAYEYDETECETDFGARYDADGTYSGFEQEGRWTIAGDVLTETVERELDDTGEMSSIAPSVAKYQLSWLSPNHLRAEIDGEVGFMIRCPPLP